MSYCAECKVEYAKKETICPNCRQRLVPVLRDREISAAQPDSSWVVVGGVKDNLIGEMAIETLGFKNIPSMFLPSLDKKDLKKIFGNKTKEKKKSNLIMVPTEFKEEAQMILADILGDAFDLKQRKNQWI